MPENRKLKLLRLLVEKTEEKKLAWKETLNSHEYMVSFPGNTVTISDRSQDEKPGISICVLNKYGDVVEEFGEEDFTLFDGIEEGVNPIDVLRKLYSDARRIALDADKEVDSVLAHLERVA